MFEASVVCLIRLAECPIASIEALTELKTLIVAGPAVDSDRVVKAKHQSLSHRGDPDATPGGQSSRC